MSKPVNVGSEAHTLHNPRDLDGLPYQHKSARWKDTLSRRRVSAAGFAFPICRQPETNCVPSRQAANLYSSCFESLVDFPRNGHTSRSVGVDADGMRFNWQLAT